MESGNASSYELEALTIERERLELERSKAKFDQRFLTRYLAIVITAIISLTAVIISYIQSAKASAQKEKEMVMQELQQNREWNVRAASFVADHANVIFGADDASRERIREVMIVTFPANITNILFQKLEAAATTQQGKKTWQEPLKAIAFNREVTVWVNTGSGVFHCPGSQWYENTSKGEHMQQEEALRRGYRPAYDTICQ